MKKPLLVLGLLSMAAYGSWRVIGSGSGAGGAEAADSERLVLDRLWIDHMPQSETDTVNLFVALTQEPVGVFNASSMWKGEYEGFRYKARGNQLEVVYPQTRERETLVAKGVRCDERGMDYCLELRGGSRGVKRYYSREEWVIEGAASAADLRAKIEAHRASLR